MNDWWIYVVLVAGMGYLAYLRMKKASRVYRRLPDRDFPLQWKRILEQRVDFYKNLSPSDQQKFEYEVHVFLLNYQISGRETEVTDLDRILIASGAVIPTFRLEKWHYLKLEEVVLFPERFQIPETDKKASGLVGWGEMEGQVWLSRKSLYKGFHYPNDGKNVAIHEFIHLMDMQDGIVDGIPRDLMEDEDVPVWMELVKSKMDAFDHRNSDIREYAKTNPIEFLAAVGEYYFENPKELRAKHPRLYRMVDKIFNPKKNWF